MRAAKEGAPPKAIFCGNFEYNTQSFELERLFEKWGKVDKVEMSCGGFASVHMASADAAASAISALRGRIFGRRALKVEWADGVSPGVGEQPTEEDDVAGSSSIRVVGFDPRCTRHEDFVTHFAPFGHIRQLHITQRNVATLRFATAEAAAAAVRAAETGSAGSRIGRCTLTVTLHPDKGAPAG